MKYEKCPECTVGSMKPVKCDVPYQVAGLTFILTGLVVNECAHCGNREESIPAIKSLHILIARMLIDLADLKGAQIKFLRKFQRLTQAELGEQLGGIPHETISRWESDSQAYSPSSIIILKKLAEEFIAAEWRDLELFNAGSDGDSGGSRMADFYASSSMKDFIRRLAEQHVLPPAGDPKLRYINKEKLYFLER